MVTFENDVNGTRVTCEGCNTYKLLVENGKKGEQLGSSIMNCRIILHLYFLETICNRRHKSNSHLLGF